MKAAVSYGAGQPLAVEDVVMTGPARGEVVVQVGACAICQSDLHYLSGAWPGKPFPVVCGHEVAGTVVAVGRSVAGVREDDRVIVSLIRNLGTCDPCLAGHPSHGYCRAGHPYLCEATLPLDREERFANGDGARVHQGLKVGGFAEQVLVHPSQLATIPADMPLDEASLLACGVLTGYGAVFNSAKMRPGATVAVIGIGGVGINCLQAAVIGNAETVIAIDVVPEKFVLAQVLGATHTLNAKETSVTEAVMEITGGFGVDYAFVAAGSGAAIEQGAEILAKLGCLVVAALPPAGVTAQIQPRFLVNKNQSMLGTKMGSARLSHDIPVLIGHYRAGRLKLGALIAERYPLDRINDAIESAGQGAAARNVIEFASQ